MGAMASALGLQQARFQCSGHAAQTQLAQSAVEFDQVHDWDSSD